MDKELCAKIIDDLKDEFACSAAEMLFSINHNVDRNGWLALNRLFQSINLDVSRSTTAVYHASGSSAVIEYVTAVLGDDPNLVWGTCSACETSVPAYPVDTNNVDKYICLICWSPPLRCKCGSYKIDCDFRCEDCGEELTEGRF